MPRDDRRRQGRSDDTDGARASELRLSAELVPTFSGQDKTYPVSRWIQDVDDHAEIFSWTPLQQLLVARRALTGTAALWLRAERLHKNWEELKAALSKEFADTVDVKAIHEIMSARKKHKDESCLDYMLVMKELGKRGKMADYVAIKYIVDGILDRETNKIMLYGVTTYTDLKEKFKIYETLKEKMEAGSGRSDRQLPSTSRSRFQDETKKCYNCGENKHISAECPHKQKGMKCFRCNSFGHVSSQCNATSMGGDGGRTSSGGKNDSRRSVGSASTTRPRSNSASAATGSNQRQLYYCECDDDISERYKTCENGGNTEKTQDGAHDCPTSSADVMNISTHGNINKPIKAVEVHGKSVNALIDSGSEVNLISMKCFRDLGSPEYQKSDIVLTGLGSMKVRALGLFSTSVCVDGQTYMDVSFHIVPTDVIPYLMIIGQQFLQLTVMVMDNNNVRLLPSNEEWLRTLNVECVRSELDIVGPEVSPELQRRVRCMIASYKPNKTREAPIKLQIHLKDNIPVSQRPRRLALRELQEVDLQIKQWLNDGIIRRTSKKP